MKKSDIFSINVDSFSEYEKRRRSSILQEIRQNLNFAKDKARSIKEDFIVYNNKEDELDGVRGTFSVKGGVAEALNIDDEEREIPDNRKAGRRRWVVLIAGFIGLLLSTGFPFNMSVLYVEFLNEFGRSKAETALVQSVCSGTFLCAGSGFISGSLVTRFGPRKCGIFGGILVGIGLMTSYFAMHIVFLVGSIGIVAGFGFSLCYVSITSSVSQHFQGQSKQLALIFLTFGSGIGALSVPLFLELLLNYYDWRGALLVTSGVSINLCAIGCLLVRMETKSTQTAPSEIVDMKRRRSSISITQEVLDGEIQSNSVRNSLKALFTHAPYIMYILSTTTAISSFNSILVFFIDYYQAKGFNRMTAVWLYFTTNLSGCFFRFLPGLITQRLRVPILAIPCMALVVGTGTFVAYPFCVTVPHFVIVACGFGVFLGTLVAVSSITTMEITGNRYYSTGLGVSMVTSGIATIIAGPVSGLLRDVTGSYDSSFFAGSAGLLAALLILSSVGLIGYWKDRKLESFNKVIEVRRKSRRRSSLLPWKGKAEVTSM